MTDTYRVELNQDAHSVCTFVRPLEAENLSTLKLSDKVTYLSGFNVWPTTLAQNPLAYGESNLRHYTVTDAALVLISTMAAACTISIF